MLNINLFKMYICYRSIMPLLCLNYSDIVSTVFFYKHYNLICQEFQIFDV